MDNWNYQQLLPGSGSGSNPIAGAVWSDVSCDSNDVTAIINPSYVSYLLYMKDNMYVKYQSVLHKLHVCSIMSVSFSVAAW